MKNKDVRKSKGTVFGRIMLFSVPLFIFCAVASILTSYFLRRNENNVIAKVLREQKDLNNVVALNVEKFVTYEVSDETIINYLSGVEAFSGKRYVYWVVEDEVKYVRDASLTENYKGRPVNEFYKKISSDTLLVTNTTFEVNGKKHSVGIVSDRSWLREEYNLDTATILGNMIVYGVSAVADLILVALIIANERKRNIIISNDKEIKRINKVSASWETKANESQAGLEKANAEIRKMTNGFYDIKVTQKLLEKSDEDIYRPLTIAIVKLILAGSYCPKSTITEFTDACIECLSESDVITEIAKGEFSMFLFKMDEEMAQEFCQKLLSKIKPVSEKHGIVAKIVSGTINDTSVKTSELYAKLREATR